MSTAPRDFLAVGAEFPLAECLTAQLPANADVVIVPLAAAFTGATQAALDVAQQLEGSPLTLEVLLVSDRESANTAHFAQRVATADAVIVTDGSPLHLRTTLRGTALETALRQAKLVVAIGSVATVFGDPMIDPRGGAPTTGLGLFSDAVLTVASPTLERTRELLPNDAELYVVGESDGLYYHSGEWYVSTSQ